MVSRCDPVPAGVTGRVRLGAGSSIEEIFYYVKYIHRHSYSNAESPAFARNNVKGAPAKPGCAPALPAFPWRRPDGPATPRRLPGANESKSIYLLDIDRGLLYACRDEWRYGSGPGEEIPVLNIVLSFGPLTRHM